MIKGGQHRGSEGAKESERRPGKGKRDEKERDKLGASGPYSVFGPEGHWAVAIIQRLQPAEIIGPESSFSYRVVAYNCR